MPHISIRTLRRERVMVDPGGHDGDPLRSHTPLTHQMFPERRCDDDDMVGGAIKKSCDASHGRIEEAIGFAGSTPSEGFRPEVTHLKDKRNAPQLLDPASRKRLHDLWRGCYDNVSSGQKHGADHRR